jgi:hypothetical protein
VFKTRESRRAGWLALAIIAALTASLTLGITAAGASQTPSVVKRAATYSWLFNQRGGYVPVHNDCASPYCPITNWIPNNTRFQMICFVDAYYGSTGNYFSHRWFFGYYTYSGLSKFYTNVQSSYVWYQTWVPRC